MSRLQEVIKDKNNTITHRKEFSDFHKLKKKKEKKIKGIKIFITVTGIILVAGFIYIPQFFMNIEEDEVKVNINSGVFPEYNAAVRDAAEQDWDNDGVINLMETQKGLSIWKADSDGDGFTDYYELSAKTDATDKDLSLTKKMKELLTAKNEKYDMAYKINDVVLWADDIKSRTYGSVIHTPDGGYQFTNFKGYAQFPEGSVAYKIKDGRHVKLKYRKKENAYYIKEDCLVYLYDEEPEMVNKITFFRNSFYAADNFMTRFLSCILPDKGFVASSRMAVKDTSETMAGAVLASGVSSASYPADINRFSKNTNSLEDMLMYRSLIQENIPVPVLLFSDELGEYKGIAYGYTDNGNLLIADYFSKTYIGVLKISYTAETLCDGTDIYQKKKFNFKGLGFNSENGDRIYFLNEKF